MIVEGSIITDEEEEGVKAIQFLQNMVSIKEPYDRALKGWRSLEDWEKKQTLEIYRKLIEKDQKCLNTSSPS